MRTKWICALAVLLALAGTVWPSNAQLPSQSVQAALASDPPNDAKHPARLVELTVPGQGSAMNAVFYLASGARPHPAVLLLHGFPGNEQNLDLAQSMRRAGWSVLTFHYRGSWGSPGAFSFSHAIEDTDAALAFLRDPAVDSKYALDPKRIVVIGHSMGGFLALHAASTHGWLQGVAVMSAANFGGMASQATTPAAQQEMIGFFRSELPPLAGCTAESLWADVTAHAAQWNYVDWAPAIRPMPALVLEADDGLGASNGAMAEALRKMGDPRVTELHMATDHSFSDHRIAAQIAVLSWLAALPAPK